MKNFQQVVPIQAAPAPRHTTGLHLIGDLYGCICDSRLMLDAAYLEEFWEPLKTPISRPT